MKEDERQFDIINITLQQHWLLETVLEGKKKCNMIFPQRCLYSHDLQTVVFATWHYFFLKRNGRTDHCLIV